MSKRLVVVLLGFGLLLGGCSSAPSEVSPEEKRNNFELCYLREYETAREQVFDSTEWKLKSSDEQLRLLNFIEDEIEIYCKDELE